jgi:hypothetical protein
MATIEFYVGNSHKHIAVLDDGAVPRKGEFISIRGDTFSVSCVTWAVDHADLIPSASLRACVVLERLGERYV